MGVAEFKEINWLNINDKFWQCVLSSIYKFFNSESPGNLNEIYFTAEYSKINTWSSFQRLILFRMGFFGAAHGLGRGQKGYPP